MFAEEEMDITIYIKELLYLHDCVIVPDFGGFVANYKPAEINFSQNTFAPPSKTIGFNSVLTHNDGLLISYMSEQTHLGYVDVKRMVDEFVASALRRLEGGKKIAMEDIGVFYYDTQKNLQFEPDHSINFLIDSYGLSWYQFAPLQKYDVQKRIERKTRDHEPAERMSLNRTVRRILIGVPFLVALALIPLRTGFRDTTQRNYSSFNIVKTSTMPVQQQSVDEKAIDYSEALGRGSAVTAESQNTRIQEDEAKPASPAVAEEQVSDPGEQMQFFIIAGSFRSMQNAEKLQNDILSDGFVSRILSNRQGMYRVTLGEYTDRQSAVLALNRIRKIPGREEVWLLGN